MELPSLQNGTRGIMFKLIKQLLTLLTPIQRKQFYLLQILVVIMSFAEIMGVASIIPFMVLVGDMSQLEQDTVIAQVYQASGISSESQFVFILGVGVLIMLFFSAYFATRRDLSIPPKYKMSGCIMLTIFSSMYFLKTVKLLSCSPPATSIFNFSLTSFVQSCSQ